MTAEPGSKADSLAQAPSPGPQPGAMAVGRRIGAVTIGFLRRFGTVTLLVVLIVVFSAASPSFLTARNLTGLLVTQAVVGCVAFAALFPLIVGEFDLSLGYMVGFIAVLGAYVGDQHWGTFQVFAIMLIAGLVIGLVNGILTVKFKISSFISTLGTGIILSGLAQGLSGGQVLFAGVPSVMVTIGRDNYLGVPISVWLVVVLAAVLLYTTEHTPFGRRLFAIGGSERVAFLAGIATQRLKVVAFLLAGLLVAIGAIFELGAAGAANPTFGPEVLLPAYAAVFLGVTTYKPGYYNVVGTVVAIVILAVGFNGLSLLGVPFWVQPLFNGAVLLVAVLLARSEARHVRVSA